MNNSEQTLELQLKSEAQGAKKEVDTLVKSLTNVENVLTNIYLELGRIEKKSTKTTDEISDGSKKIKNETDKASSSFNKLFKVINFAGTTALVRRFANTFGQWMNLAIDRTEQMNLFNVVFKNIEENGTKTFSKLGKEALDFQNKLNDAFGTNMTDTLRFQGLFQSMGENVGIADTYSAIMSETMTKLTYDLASLYNKGEKATAEALRAGVYAGQTKPLRNFGIDVTQTSMQPILDSLGIERSVKQMSQAEKEILRYLATLRQAKVAMGDFANTIESPANQMKIFKNQLVEAKVALTSLFIGTFSKILPYANAILMVIVEISKAIATMFGIELQDYNSGIATYDYDDYLGDIGDSADDATGSVKELKRQLLGFDQVNNINENKDKGSSGSGTSGVGGIDQRLLDAIKGYDNGMDKIRMKAKQIRDDIMHWLGFEEGEGGWYLKEGYTRFEKILDAVKLIGLGIAGWKVSKGIMNFLGALNVIDKKDIFTKALGLTFYVTGLVLTADAINGLLNEGATWQNVTKALGGALGVASGVFTLTKDIRLTLIATSIVLVVDAGIAIKDLWDEIQPDVEEMGGLWETWKDGAGVAIDWVKDKITDLKDTIDKKIDEIGVSLFGNEEDWNLWKDNILNVIDLITWNFPSFISRSIGNFQELNDEIENNGGAWQSWKDGIDVMLEELGIKKYFTKGYWTDKFAGLRNGLKENGGVWETWKTGIGVIMGKLGISKFFTKSYWTDKFSSITDSAQKILDKLRNKFESFTANIKTPHIEWVNDGWKATGTLKKIMETLNLPTTMPKMNIKWYANGGSPTHGTVFGAGENGPEVVGHINGRTEVLNQSQIASAIYSAVYSAMSQFSGQQKEIDVHVHTDEGVIVDRINQKTAQTGVFPLNIPY